MIFACDSCSKIIKVEGWMAHAQRLLLSHPRWNTNKRMCPWCDGTMFPVSMNDKATITRVSLGIVECTRLIPEEALLAMCGGGLPGEVGFSAEIIEALLMSSPIKGIKTRTSPTNKVIIDALELSNGLTIHLVANANGAGVLKITRRTNEPMDDAQLDIFENIGDPSVQGDNNKDVGDEGERGLGN